MRNWLHKARYLQLSRNGVFRYRRVVPEPLRIKAGRWEILVSLRTKDPKAAELPYLKAHVAAEEWLQSLVAIDQPGRHPRVPLPYPFRQSMASLPRQRQIRLMSGKYRLGDGIPLSEALRVYLDEKRPEFDAYRGRERKIRYDEKHRLMGYLIEALGSDRDVASLTRQDARTFRDWLGSAGSPARQQQLQPEQPKASVHNRRGRPPMPKAGRSRCVDRREYLHH